MPRAIQLLKQVRKALNSLSQGMHSSEHRALLDGADLLLNELMAQQEPAFYLDYLRRGRLLLEEGQRISSKFGCSQQYGVTLNEDINAQSRSDVLEATIDELHELLARVAATLDESRSSEEKSFLVRLCDLENSLYVHRLLQIPPPVSETQVTPAALEQYLRRRHPAHNVRLLAFQPLNGGYSKKTILFEIDDSVNGPQSLVLRAEHPVDLLCYDGSDVTQEFPMVQFVRRMGVPVAEPLWVEADRVHLGTRFIVSRKVQGRSYGDWKGSTEAIPTGLVESMIANLTQLHCVQIDPSDSLVGQTHLKNWLPYRSLRDCTYYQVTEFIPKIIQRSDIQVPPQLLRGLKWLRNNVPDCNESPVIVHSDFGFNNLLFRDNRVIAVLDWESSHLGDPAEDIIWTQQNLSAHISMPEFLCRYKTITGRNISQYRLAYFQVVKCVLAAIACLRSLRAFDLFDATHIELGTLAYRSMGLFGPQFNVLIENAEAARGT